MPEKENKEKVMVYMNDDLRKQLRRTAEDHGSSHGIVARALIRYGVRNADDPEVIATIEDEVEDVKAARAAAGKRAMQSRWKDEQS